MTDARNADNVGNDATLLIRTSSLWRIGGVALTVGSLGNVLLGGVTDYDDTFAATIAIAAGISVIGLLITHYVKILYPWTYLVLLWTMAVFVTNTLELMLEHERNWDTRLRMAGFYLGFAMLALGMYLTIRPTRWFYNDDD